MCDSASTKTSSPFCVWHITASTFAMVPVGTKTAAALPVILAARASRAFTVGSSPKTSSPTRARAIASRMAPVGSVTVSLRRSITRTAVGAAGSWRLGLMGRTGRRVHADSPAGHGRPYIGHEEQQHPFHGQGPQRRVGLYRGRWAGKLAEHAGGGQVAIGHHEHGDQ